MLKQLSANKMLRVCANAGIFGQRQNFTLFLGTWLPRYYNRTSFVVRRSSSRSRFRIFTQTIHTSRLILFTYLSTRYSLCRQDLTFGIHPSAHDSVLTARSTQVNIITRVVFISVLYMLFSSMRDVVMIGGDNCIVSSIKLRALN